MMEVEAGGERGNFGRAIKTKIKQKKFTYFLKNGYRCFACMHAYTS